MAKIAIITDSNSGITQKQGEEQGIYVLPMPFMINDETYFEDINLDAEKFYQEQTAGSDILTSQPSPESVTSLWDKLLGEGYDEIVHIPMSSGLSGSCQSAMMLAQDYDGKVQDLSTSIEGKNVIVVEDIIDTGRTLSYLLENLKTRSPKSVRLCTLLDKPERRVVDVKVDYVGFEIPDEFVVGYGLDYDQQYRNLPYIGFVEIEE